MSEGIVFPLNVRDLRKRLKMAGFRGNVQALSAIGDIPNAHILCAALFCSNSGPHHVYINTQVDCDHLHLTVDIVDLVHAYENGDLDQGWEQLPNGDARTGITTREDAVRAGVPETAFAHNPYRLRSS